MPSTLPPGLTAEHLDALNWARNQNVDGDAARYAKLCAQAYDFQAQELAREVCTRSARVAEIDNLRERANELTAAARHWRTMFERQIAITQPPAQTR